jgi:hypothetical protein
VDKAEVLAAEVRNDSFEDIVRVRLIVKWSDLVVCALEYERLENVGEGRRVIVLQ